VNKSSSHPAAEPAKPASTNVLARKPITDLAYINHPNGVVCPWCGSQNVTFSGTDITFHGDSIGQASSCDDCDKKWETIYTLTGYEA
jgi:hypothetical protein